MLPMHAMGESEARDQNASRVHVPHIFNGDSPVVLVPACAFLLHRLNLGGSRQN